MYVFHAGLALRQLVSYDHEAYKNSDEAVKSSELFTASSKWTGMDGQTQIVILCHLGNEDACYTSPVFISIDTGSCTVH